MQVNKHTFPNIHNEWMCAIGVDIRHVGGLVPRPDGVGDAIASQHEPGAGCLLSQAIQFCRRGDGRRDLKVLVLHASIHQTQSVTGLKHCGWLWSAMQKRHAWQQEHSKAQLEIYIYLEDDAVSSSVENRKCAVVTSPHDGKPEGRGAVYKFQLCGSLCLACMNIMFNLLELSMAFSLNTCVP